MMTVTRRESSEMAGPDSKTNKEDGKQFLHPLPRKELLLIWIVHASQGFQTTMLFPLLVFMVQEYGLPAHATGKYAGLLASLYPFAQFCTSFLWGKLSDRTGRKKWIIFGNIVAAFASIFLGICKTFPAACAVRFTSGFLNGSVTLTKSMLGELCDGSNQAKCFAVLNLAWGIGSIIGPVLAGLLAQPCLQYKLAKCPVFLSEYPFLLPCICAFLFSLSSAIASSQMKETNPHRRKHYSAPSHYSCAEMLQFPADKEEDTEEKLTFMAQGGSERNGDVGDAVKFPDISEEMFVKVPEVDITTKHILQDRSVLLVSLCYSMTGLIFIITDELFPLFGAASKSITLGLILGEGGIALFVYTLLLYPKLAERFGPLQSFRIGLLTTVPMCIMFPATSLLRSIPVLQFAILFVAMAGKSVAGCNAFTSVLILVANSATHEKMGAVTGLSHSFCSLFRAVGPAFGGLVWSFSVQKTFYLHQFLAWLVVTFLIFFNLFLSFLLPSALNKPKIITQNDSGTLLCS